MAAYVYDQTYHDYALRISKASALRMVPIVQSILPVKSVLDVGCSCGTWLLVWKEQGITDYLGIDGDYIDIQTLLIDRRHFACRDLAKPFHLGRTFDLVQCLEVAEHLPEGRAEQFVIDLTAHGSAVLFSAAPPGQGGEQHLNERPYDYWRTLFAAQGFMLLDCLRPAIRQFSDISPWYRYNAFLFVRREVAAALSSSVQASEIKMHEAIPDLSPWTYRMRKALIQRLPFALRQRLAKAKARGKF